MGGYLNNLNTNFFENHQFELSKNSDKLKSTFSNHLLINLWKNHSQFIKNKIFRYDNI